VMRNNVRIILATQLISIMQYWEVSKWNGKMSK